MIGIDIIAIDRFAKISSQDYEYWSKFFTKAEWKYCFTQSDSSQSLAGVLSAKEAVMKAAGKDFLQRFDRIGIHHGSDGKPIVKIDKQKQSVIHVSISHDAGIAVSVAIAYER